MLNKSWCTPDKLPRACIAFLGLYLVISTRVKNVLNISAEFDVLTIIPTGYPAEMPPEHVEEDRLPVDDLMNFESFT